MILIICWLIGLQKQANLTAPFTPQVQRQLLDLACDVKQQLSSDDSVAVQFAQWTGQINRGQFEELITPLVKRTLMSCRRALKDADITADEVLKWSWSVVRPVPLVRQLVGDFLWSYPLTSIDQIKSLRLVQRFKPTFWWVTSQNQKCCCWM